MERIHIEPIDVPSFMIDPENKQSFNEMEALLLKRAIWEELKLAFTNHQASTPIIRQYQSLEAFSDSLTDDEYSQLKERAEIYAMASASKIEELSSRVSMGLAYKVLRKQSFRNHGEYEYILDLLFEKLDTSKSKTSIAECVFLLEAIQAFETASGANRGYGERVFKNKIVYGKLVAGIPAMRRKQMSLVYAKSNLRDTMKEIQVKQDRLRRDQSTARMKGAGDGELKMFSDEIVSLEGEKELLEKNSALPIEHLEADYRVTTAAVIELAQSDTARDMVAQSVPLVAKVYLEREGYNPSEVSSDYSNTQDRNEKAKPIVHVIQLANQTLFVMGVKPKFSKMVTRYIEEMFDSSPSTLDEAINLLYTYKNPKKEGTND